MNAAATQAALGPYRLLRVVAEGPRGTVHEGIDPKHPGQRVALRTWPAAFFGLTDALKRMRRNARTATDLQHPNIVSLYECGEHDGTAFVATEFVEGDTLAQHLACVGRLPVLQGVALAAQLLCALDFAHRRQLVHGAIQPGNVLVSRTGQLKMAGFGWAAAAAPGPKQPGPFGDHAYMAPEQLGGAPADQRSDLYGAARVVHDLLAGRLPEAHAGTPGALSAQLQAVFDRALAHDARQRYDNAADFSAALQAAVGTPMWERPPVGANLVEVAPPASAVTPPAVPDGAGQSMPTVPPAQRVDVPVVRAPHAVAPRASRPLSSRARRTLGAAAVALILIAAVFMVREPTPAVPEQNTVQQPEPAAQVNGVGDVQAKLEAAPTIDLAAIASGSSPAVQRVDPAGEQMPPAPPSSAQQAVGSSADMIMPLEKTSRDVTPSQQPEPQALAPALMPSPSPSPGSPSITQREASSRGSASSPRVASSPSGASMPRASARATLERNAQRTARERRSAVAARSAQRSPIGLACDQAMAIGREVCRAVRCVSPEFRRHPVCVRLDLDRRARDAEREWRGSN